MTQTRGTAGATPPARPPDLVIPNTAEVALALGQAAADSLWLANRELLDFWAGYLEHVWGVGGRRAVPRSAEESFQYQTEYVSAVLDAHMALWASLVASPSPLPAAEAASRALRRAA
jgi:hypothetical protein